MKDGREQNRDLPVAIAIGVGGDVEIEWFPVLGQTIRVPLLSVVADRTSLSISAVQSEGVIVGIALAPGGELETLVECKSEGLRELLARIGMSDHPVAIWNAVGVNASLVGDHDVRVSFCRDGVDLDDPLQTKTSIPRSSELQVQAEAIYDRQLDLVGIDFANALASVPSELIQFVLTRRDSVGERLRNLAVRQRIESALNLQLTDDLLSRIDHRDSSVRSQVEQLISFLSCEPDANSSVDDPVALMCDELAGSLEMEYYGI